MVSDIYSELKNDMEHDLEGIGETLDYIRKNEFGNADCYDKMYRHYEGLMNTFEAWQEDYERPPWEEAG